MCNGIRKPKFRLGAVQLSSWERKYNYRKDLSKKSGGNACSFPQDFHKARLQAEEANLLLLFPRQFHDLSNHHRESQDNEWNQAMHGAKINWVNVLTVLNGLVSSYQLLRTLAPRPSPSAPQARFPYVPLLHRTALSRTEACAYYEITTLFYFPCISWVYFLFKKFFWTWLKKQN